MVLALVALWIGSAIAGWFGFWPWLMAPLLFIGIHIARASARMRAAYQRNGLLLGGTGRPGTSMVGPNVKLLTVTLVQHLVIFGIAFAISLAVR